jgi:F420-dependent oxidoreductase-like protein
MRLGLDVSQHQLTWRELLERAGLAEGAGFDGVWVFDHFKPLYGDRSGPCLEGWALLAALASATERVRLGTLVTGITYRHPSILAAQAVTIDHVSQGRLELAVGAAWFEREHRELGIPFPPTRERIRRLDEGVSVMRLLMTEDRARFDGRYYRLDDASYNPKPVQQPHPPIWIGGGGERLMLPLVARQADVWHDYGSVRELVRKSRLIDEHAERTGRDPRLIARASSLSLSQPWDQVRATAQALAEARFSYLVVSWPSEGRARLEEFVTDVMPDVRDS